MSTTTTIPKSLSTQSAPASTKTCIETTPDANGYVPDGSCNSYYNFYPSFGANLAFAVLFFLSFVVHTIQMFVYRKASDSPTAGEDYSLTPFYRNFAGLSLWVPRGRWPRLSSGRLGPRCSRTCSLPYGAPCCCCWRLSVRSSVDNLEWRPRS
jgi:hypothetical protein